MRIYLQKHVEGDLQYVRATDVLELYHMDESNPKVQRHLDFLFLAEQYVNFFNEHTSNAFGNPDLRYIEGQLNGYCRAKGWRWTETDKLIRVSTGKRNRTLYLIDKIPLSEAEILNRQEWKDLLDNI